MATWSTCRQAKGLSKSHASIGRSFSSVRSINQTKYHTRHIISHHSRGVDVFPTAQPKAPPPSTHTEAAIASRRRAIIVSLASAALVGASNIATTRSAEAALAGVSCPGLNGYALQQCLREARKAREVAEAAADETPGSSSSSGSDSAREERLRYRQYEQPGTLVTLPSGLQYRELLEGSGPEAVPGSICEITYIVYRLSSGAYYKYSSGGTPVFLFSLGYGQEGKDDVGQTYRFRLGEPGSLPAAVTPALVGMRQSGKRRVLVPPRLGWVDDKVGPRPDTFGGQRRLAGHKDEPLLFEVELVRVRQQALGQPSEGSTLGDGAQVKGLGQGGLFRLPAPPTYYGSGKV